MKCAGRELTQGPHDFNVNPDMGQLRLILMLVCALGCVDTQRLTVEGPEPDALSVDAARSDLAVRGGDVGADVIFELRDAAPVSVDEAFTDVVDAAPDEGVDGAAPDAVQPPGCPAESHVTTRIATCFFRGQAQRRSECFGRVADGPTVDLFGAQFGQLCMTPRWLDLSLTHCTEQVLGLEAPGWWGAFYPVLALIGPPEARPAAEYISDVHLQRWNPAFLAWVIDSLVPAPDECVDGVPLRRIYPVVFAHWIRAYAIAYVRFHRNGRYATEAEAFRAWLTARPESPPYLAECGHDQTGLFPHSRSDLDCFLDSRISDIEEDPLLPGDDWERRDFLHFWLRRASDQTDALVWRGLRRVLRDYDREWYEQLAVEYAGVPVEW